MSISSNHNNKKNGKKIFTRIMATILVILMLLGTVSMVISFLANKVMAYEDDTFLVRIGLMYGTDVTVGFETTSEYGYKVGTVDENNVFTEIFSTGKTLVAATCCTNLINDNRNLVITNSETADIGAYTLYAESSYDMILSDVRLYSSLFGASVNVFPAYIEGRVYVGIGNFKSREEAYEFLDFNSAYLIGFDISSPSDTGVMLVCPVSNNILFIHDDPNTLLGTQAIQDITDEDTEYITTPANNDYDGIFAYGRYRTNSVDGVSVTNILDIETYTEGVIPSEIYTSWNIEAIRAFAISVRTFTVECLGSHSNLGFDLCNSSCCQVYRGRTNVNDAVMEAVADTHGIIATYKGKAAKMAYSSCVGGVTVSPEDAWGSVGDFPYLAAKATPWEKYEEYHNGLWTSEATPDDILKYLNKKGYTLLKGSISNIEITEYAENSSYIKKLKITDVFGTPIEIKYSDNVRIALSSFVKSANFVVGLGGTDVEQTSYMLDDYNGIGSASGYSVCTADGIEDISSVSECDVLTADGYGYLDEDDKITVLTADGIIEIDATADEGENISALELTGTPVAETDIINLPGASHNFVFVGKGWGHGVGMSQYGIKELADSGYGYDDILYIYLPGTTLENFHNILNA